MKKKQGKCLLFQRVFLMVTLALFQPTSGHDEKVAASINKEEVINNTLVVSDSSVLIQELLKTHQSEMKEMIKKVNSLESNVQVLNDRVGRQENEIVTLKTIVSHQKKRERRGISSPRSCTKGLSCAFATKGTTSPPVASKKPANCEDLESMGHTLNGFYLVQGNRDKISLKIKVETIYCDFYKRQSLGNLTDAYTGTRPSIRGVQFYVQRNISLSGTGVKVDFQVERLNEGGAMDLTTGVFTAPISGIYSFSFSANKGKDRYAGAEVHLYHNGQLIGTAYGAPGDRQALTMQSILELKSGDRIYLVKGSGDEIYASTAVINTTLTTHFTGWLMDSGL